MVFSCCCVVWGVTGTELILTFLLLAVVLPQITLPVPYELRSNFLRKILSLWVYSLMSFKIEPILNHIGIL